MAILSPEDRAVLWRHVVESPADERESMLRVLAGTVLETLGSRLSLYSGFEDQALDSLALIDRAGLVGEPRLRQAFEEIDKDSEHAQLFLAELAELLDATGRTDRLDADSRQRAFDLAATWRDRLEEEAPSSERDYFTVAEVASLFEVSPQAVYKWIQKERIRAERRPGGSIRLPADQFADTLREQRAATKRFRQLRARRVRTGEGPSEEEAARLLLEARQRRR